MADPVVASSILSATGLGLSRFQTAMARHKKWKEQVAKQDGLSEKKKTTCI